MQVAIGRGQCVKNQLSLQSGLNGGLGDPRRDIGHKTVTPRSHMDLNPGIHCVRQDVAAVRSLRAILRTGSPTMEVTTARRLTLSGSCAAKARISA
jgi:hypothetical protein